jgi:ABC-type multidrug transport system permease subunit
MADDERDVVVADAKRRFRSIGAVMVKWVVAAMPALLVLLVVGAVASSMIAALFGDVLPLGITRWWAR